ncbi:hypothetical protein roselon_00600 [Roseibacterium elongatum DSM 19469]|uniref:Uncharacterized protein n=1 Tax=Roseicyclus elongatus DSM 19469 TaxID=1294273 RepID=W8SKK0_9RHOB|nr:hypothetical protein [Roseibacterium elongatum]AHM03040.1 hypothetical protein roselon_00600 [Roseibacterium elongatum DSM 19469]
MTVMRMNRIKPAPDPRKPSRMAPALAEVYGEKGREFLSHLRQFGQVTYAANMTGLTRRTFYDRRAKNREFREAWDDALASFEEELTQRVVQTAMEMGTGRWVPVIDPETGEPVLDADFEVVHRFETGHVDSRILTKLLSLRMSSADGPSQTNVTVNSQTNVHAPPARPRLVRPEPDDVVRSSTGSVRRPLGTVNASGARDDAIDAEVLHGAPEDDRTTSSGPGRDDD